MRMPTSVRLAAAAIILTGLGLTCSAWGDVPGLEVSVGTQPARLQTYSWTIETVAGPEEVDLTTAETGLASYTAVCDATSIEGGYHVTGEIAVTNNTGAPVTVTGVSVVVMPDIEGSVECEAAFPYDLAAGGTFRCDYIAQLPCTMTRNVWATVETTAGEQRGMGVSDFAYAITEEIDERIDLDDSLAGYLGFCLAWEAPVQVQYSAEIGPFAEPGDWLVVDTLSFTTNDTLTTGSSDWTTLVHVTPAEGEGEVCTFSAGYWKTHSEFGPAPYDCTWAGLAQGACTPFFLSGQTHYQVLWTPPRGGNAYYILAHQYIAAELNMLSGASAPDDVLDVFDGATELLEAYTPEQIGELRGNDGLRQLFLCLAGTLGRYNDWDIGSCDGEESDGGCGDEAASARRAHRPPVGVASRARLFGPGRRARH